FCWDDVPAIVDVINRSDAVDRLGRDTSEDEVRTWWGAPRARPERHAFLAVVGPEVVGYGRIQLRAGDQQNGFSKIQCYGRVLPEWRGHGIGTCSVFECERRARARVGEATTATVYLEAYADERQEDVAELYAAFGLEPVRYFFDMVYDAREPPAKPGYPPGYSARTFACGRDEERTWRVINAAFSDHWGHIHIPLEEWLHWVDSALFDPNLAVLGIAPGGDVVGECLCTIDPEKNRWRGREEGWVDSLGVRREHRGRGLGRAMLLEGMAGLRRRGCTQFMLGVDSDNPTGAPHLYETVGFRKARTGVTYRKLLRG
ncbi:MAG: GNAT family N-acetyltransferase, partial [Anaerolineae bacterium]